MAGYSPSAFLNVIKSKLIVSGIISAQRRPNEKSSFKYCAGQGGRKPLLLCVQRLWSVRYDNGAKEVEAIVMGASRILGHSFYPAVHTTKISCWCVLQTLLVERWPDATFRDWRSKCYNGRRIFFPLIFC